MLSENHTTSSGFPYFPSIARNSTMGRVLGVVERCLDTFPVNFPISMANRHESPENSDETDFNTELAHWLNVELIQANLNGQFVASGQFPQGRKGRGKTSRTIDFVIRLTDGTPFLILEGKRLHNSYDKQYVSGDNGGINRFRNESHGKNHAFACMIGYVQTGSFGFWNTTINRWIEAEKWGELLSLPNLVSENLAVCTSKHVRSSQPPIELCHYWVNVSRETALDIT